MEDVKRRNISMEDDEPQRGKNLNNVFDEKNYLDVKLSKDEDEKSIIFRILPFDSTLKPFKIIHMHTIKVPKEIAPEGDGWKSYVCLKNTSDIDHDKFGYKCPFCEENKKAYDKKVEADKAHDAETSEKWKAISLANKAQEVAIVRGIQRGKESEGPKFWKFSVRSDKKDPMNMIKELNKTREMESIDIAKEENNGVLPEGFVPENILDLYEGKDLKITIKAVYDKEGRRTKKTSISITDYGKNKPVTTDYDQLDKWIDDPKHWSSVFVPKPYDYTSLLIKGEIPFFDKEQNKWVSKSSKTEEQAKRIQNRNNEEEAFDTKIKQSENKVLDESDNEVEELPF